MNLEEALKEIERLKKANEKLESDNLSLKSELSKEQKEKLEYKLKYEEMILKLQDAIEKEKIKKHRLFGVKSEAEKQILNEAEKESNKESDVIAKKGRKPNISTIERFLDSLVSFKTINVTKEEYRKLLEQEGYIKIGENKCHKLEYVPGRFELIEYVYDQIKDINNDMILPSDRDDPFPNSYLTPSLASEILINKYLLGIPLYRMEQYWNKQGIPISRMNLANYVIDAAYELYPIYEAIKYYLIHTKYKILHADETTLTVLEINAGKNKKRSKSYIWVYATGDLDHPMVIYDFKEDRKGENPKNFLKEYKGLLEVDGYEGYNNISNVELCCCWSHARRHYTDLIDTLNEAQKKTSLAVTLVKVIDEMFHLDKVGLKKSKDMDEYLAYRKENIQPIVDKYYQMIDENIDGTVGKLRVAMEYSIKLKDKLTRFLSDSKIPLTNNRAERCVKPFVMCRKNFLFSKSIAGAEASAIVMSVIQTAKENGLEVQSYLTYLFANLYKDKQSNIDNYLPWNEGIQKQFSVIKSKRT